MNIPDKVFITATDTDAGKTFVSIQILNELIKSGKKPFYFKPVASGCVFDNDKLVSEDVLKVLEKTKLDYDLDLINPIKLKTPASPNIAAEMEKKYIDVNVIKKSFDFINQKYKNIICEGVGGVMVPLTDDYLVLDLIKDFNLPCVIVTRPVLGTINHTLLTIEILKNNNVDIYGIIVTDTSKDHKKEEVMASFDVIKNISKLPILKFYDYDNDF